MDTAHQNESAGNKKPSTPPAAKKGPVRLPSKPISFQNQPVSKNGKQGKVTVNKSKKGGVNLMKKLSGM
jgi:hypothetical protein